MRELVTVQVGSFANFVGSHFWNFQDELLGLAADPDADPIFKNQQKYLNTDTLYRTGETQQGVLTYTPRVVTIGSQGSLGCMSSRGSLYNEQPSASSNDANWMGNVSTVASEPRRRNLFLQSLYAEEENFTLRSGVSNGQGDIHKGIQDEDIVESLENEVQYWTDFSKVHYHPQSVYEVSGLWGDEELDSYGNGRDMFSGGLRGEEISERLRFFVEECDHVQGFQFIVDDSGGFSALAADFLENVSDEYTSTPVLLYSVRGPGFHMNARSNKQTVSRGIHDAVSFSRLSSFCKLIVPVGLPFLSTSKAASFLRIEDQKAYHCSAVYASALHSISLPFRMESLGPTADSYYASGAIDVHGVIRMLAGQGRSNMVATLDVAMPAPSIFGEQFEQSLVRKLHPLTPEVAEDVEDLQATESMTVHGTLASGGQNASISEVKDSINAAYAHTVMKPKFCHLSVSLCPLPIPLPFPKIFRNLVGQRGELLSSPIPGLSSRGSLDVHSIPMAARLRSSSAILPFLETRLGNLRRFAIQRGASGTELVKSWGFGKEELEDMEESLSKMCLLALQQLLCPQGTKSQFQEVGRRRLFSRNSLMSDIGSEVRREVNAGIASVSRMMERLETRDNDGENQAPISNHWTSRSVSEGSNQNNADTHIISF